MRLRTSIAVLMVGLAAGTAQAQSVTYGTRTAAGVTAHVITVNMNDPQVKVSVTVSQGCPGADEPFASMVKRSGAVAAINGTFFGKGTYVPIGDIVADGRLLHQGRMGTALAITPRNKVLFGRVTWGHAADWTGYETVLACGPTLVKKGRIDLKVSEEGFRDPHVLGAAVRSAVGLTANNRLLLVSIPRGVKLAKLAEVMKALGCVEAMNLDGGASMAMYYRGRTVVPAGRKLTNILVVHEKATHLDLGETVAVPEGNGSQQTPANGPRPPARPGAGNSYGMAALQPPPAVPAWYAAYPGAELDGEANGIAMRHTTTDSVEQVAAFYRKQLGSAARVQTTQFGQMHQGIIQMVSGPGLGTSIYMTRPDERSDTTIQTFFHQPGTPLQPLVTLPKPVTSSFMEDVQACSVPLSAAPPGVPVYPGTKRAVFTVGTEQTAVYTAPAGLEKVLAFYREQLGARARISLDPTTKGMGAARILSGAGSGTLVLLNQGAANRTAINFFKEKADDD